MISHRSRRVKLPDYIAPLPEEAFLKGITYRQQQYDEGRALVQKQLDAYGQIRDSFIKPQDKEYFDQEALKLVKALNSKAGLDFSMKANVQSALNTGKQLINDPIIKQAAESTATYKKMMEEYNKLDASKRSTVNDYFFFKDMKSWMEDGKYGSKLNYNPYTVYTDEHIKLKADLANKLKPNTQEVLEFSKDGKWIIKNKYTGVSAKRFKQAYVSGLSEQAKNQLRMEAQYRVETGDKNTIITNYQKYINDALTDLNTKIESVEADKQSTISKYGEGAPELSRINAELSDLNLTRQIYQEKANTPSANISDGELASYIQDELINESAGAFEYQQKSQELQENPYVLDDYRSANDLALYKQKAAFNMKYGLNADGTVNKKDPKDYLPFGATKLTASDINKTISGLPGAGKGVQGFSIGLLSQIDNELDGKGITDGMYNYLDINKATNGSTQTVAEALKRTIVNKTWSEKDRNNILSLFIPISAKQEFLKTGKIPEKSRKLAEASLDYLSKLAASVYNIYDLQAGQFDGENLNNLANDLLRGGKGIVNQNTQSDYVDKEILSKLEGELELSSTYNDDGTGLTFVPKASTITVVYRDKLTDGDNYGVQYPIKDFLNADASKLQNIQDIRIEKPDKD